MTSFGWKRKAGENVSKEAAQKFLSDELKDSGKSAIGNMDWTENFKRRKALMEESCEAKSKELKSEGVALAEAGRYQEAIEKWTEAIQLMPCDARLHEMKAQALMQLNEPFCAVKAAETSIQSDPKWWVAYQTLGRAQMGVGEIKMAITNFCKALHINPASEELWEKDLRWALSLLDRKGQINQHAKTHQEKAAEEASKLVFDEDGFIVKECAENDSADLVQCRF